jgi:type IV secretory pathway TraG/TraD family ATPase VirD4
MTTGYKEPHAFKGFEQWWHAVQMSAKVYVYCFVSVLVFHLLIPAVYFVVYDRDIIDFFLKSVLKFQFQYASVCGKYFLKRGLEIFLYATPVWLLYPILLLKFKKKAKKIVEDEHIRGSQLITDGEFVKEITKIAKEPKTKDAHLIHFGKIPIPWKAENRHFLIVGRPGTGKTTLLNQIIEKLRQREEKCIIYDFKGDYLSCFYDPSKDFVFNPLDSRCINWCLFDEIEMLPDIDSIATSMIPPSTRDDKFWTDAARDIFSSILHYLTVTGNRTNQAIWELVSYTEPQMLQLMQDAVMQGVEPAKKALGYLQGYEQGSKVASDTLSTMRQYTNCFLYMRHLQNSFSIKRWLDEDGGSFLFVSNYANLRDTLKPILSLMIDLAMKHILSMHEDIDRRRFIIIDEFASLQRLTTIVQCLEQGRSKGASLWLATQDISQLQKLYGYETTHTIANNCNTILSFAVSDPNSQEYLSRLFGETEILETDESLSMGPSDMRDGLTLQRRRRKEPLLLPSQFGILPDFCFYLKMLSYPVTQSKITWKGYPKKNQAFMLNPIFSLKGGDEE